MTKNDWKDEFDSTVVPWIGRSCIYGIVDFQRNGKRVALKGQPTELNKRILQTVPYVIRGDWR